MFPPSSIKKVVDKQDEITWKVLDDEYLDHVFDFPKEDETRTFTREEYRGRLRCAMDGGFASGIAFIYYMEPSKREMQEVITELLRRVSARGLKNKGW